jgi:hypothetical protein
MMHPKRGDVVGLASSFDDESSAESDGGYGESSDMGEKNSDRKSGMARLSVKRTFRQKGTAFATEGKSR